MVHRRESRLGVARARKSRDSPRDARRGKSRGPPRWRSSTNPSLAGARSSRRRAVGSEDCHIPEDAEVLHPFSTFNQRSNRKGVSTRSRGRLDGELEPRHLPGSDIVGRLNRNTVVARPICAWRSDRTVAPEDTRLILAWHGVPGTEIRDLTKIAA